MQNSSKRCFGAALGALTVLVAVAAQAAPADSLRQAVQAQSQTNDAAAKSQVTVNQASDEAQKLLEEYLTDKEQIDRLRVYNQNLTSLVRDQQDTISSINTQMKDVEVVEKEIVPLMLKMVDTLGQFVQLDLPFLKEERMNRVAQLREMMDSSSVTISEKYRRIIEAYQIELEYGRTLESYQGLLSKDDPRTVSFVRLGRVSLLYQTLDGAETGYWDAGNKKWVVDNSYAHAVAEARRVAKKDGAPDLLTVPVPAPQEVKS